ncbi:MAG: hypothetical protein ACI9OU_001713 [Candidatus Promineifilaceae bacterium]|jgi:hypothetical protein
MRVGLLVCGLVFALAGVTECLAKDTTRILLIGNSYTGQIRKTFTQLVKASPHGASTELAFIAPGGKTLAYHLGDAATVRKITEGNWDLVVLQDQSQTPALSPDVFAAAAVGLDKYIDAAGAKTVLYQTWGRRDGDKRNAERFPDYASMQKALSTSYRSAAKRCDAILAPVGDTWSRVRAADTRLGNALYKTDGSHPSDKGAYLAACVLYAAIFEESPKTIPFKDGVSGADATMILEAVAATRE